ncbi:alpha-hydroxy acid oxidase [Pseudorhodobacter aquimaris]|uniref:alpha-hydroxy acid oxidase n=1 Tax=Pseudorhodobacter aquimaris TaxID=687412 RepID=UPI00067D6A54|nr:alpha-hydroxy acid oxidase [Pseudorhodobacter aquimaris]
MAKIIASVRRKAVTTARNLRGVYALDDFEVRAQRLLPKSIFGYVSGGVETDATLRANREVFKGITFQPRVLRDVSVRSLKTKLFDETHSLPFAIAPMGFSALVAYDGDVCLAKAARAAGSFAICSAASLTPLERVAAQGASRWFQAYIPGDNLRIAALLDRITKAGFDHLVVTADTPVAGNRENNARNGFDAPFRITAQLAWQGMTHPRWTIGTLAREIMTRGMPHFENMEAVQGPPLFSRDLVRSTIGRDQLNWDSIRFIRKIWAGKLVIKGVLHPQDARIAQDIGCDGIIVSNHGGRQLDYTTTTLAALPAIRREVPDMTVMFDSGVRRGTDVLKAIMLGADFVFVGRPFLYAAATHGEQGVAHAMDLLAAEVDRDMAFLGITTPQEIRDHATQ